jgi:hypothetical protein
MDIQLLFLKETLLTGFAGIRQDSQVRLHVIVHRILLRTRDTTVRAKIVTGCITQIGHTGLGRHGAFIERILIISTSVCFRFKKEIDSNFLICNNKSKNILLSVPLNGEHKFIFMFK